MQEKNLPFCNEGTKPKKPKSVTLAFTTVNNHVSAEDAPNACGA